MDSPYHRELLVCFAALRQAAHLSQAVLAEHDKGAIEKDDLSPVTVADFAVQALLTATIHASFPDDRFVGEESAAALRANPALLGRVWGLLSRVADAVASSSRSSSSSLVSVPQSSEQACEMIDWCASGIPSSCESGRVWVFDPIDGTKAFVRGEMYAINVGLLEGGVQVLGAVACPLLSINAKAPISDSFIDPAGEGCILFAARGHGAFVQPLKETAGDAPPPHRLDAHASPAKWDGQLRSVSCADALDSGLDGVHRGVAAKLDIAFPGCDLLGWVPRWSSLAMGLANVTVWVYRRPDRRAKIWDHAGAMLLFEEAGGKITDVHGRPIDLRTGRKLQRNFGFVAAPPAAHARVLATVHEVLREQGYEDLLASTLEM